MDVDCLARHLSRVGSLASQMPRGAFENAGRTHPFYAGNRRVGHMLPGIGLVLDADREKLGITRDVPHVFDRTPLMRVVERALRDPSAQITSRAQLASQYAATNFQTQRSDSLAWLNQDVCGTWFNTFDNITTANWTTGGSSCNRTTPKNAWNVNMMDPPSGHQQYLVGLGMMLAGTGTTNNGFSMMMLVDILSQSGNLNLSSTGGTGPFSFSTPALTRYTSGAGVYMSYQPQSAQQLTYSASTTVTVTYVNQAGTTGRTTTFTTSSAQSNGETPNDVNNIAGYSLPFIQLAAGDYGVRSLTSVAFSAATTTSGNGSTGAMLYAPLLFQQPMYDVGITIERSAATEPQKMMIPLATESGGTLGYLSAFYCVSGTNAGFGPSAQILNVTMDYCWI